MAAVAAVSVYFCPWFLFHAKRSSTKVEEEGGRVGDQTVSSVCGVSVAAFDTFLLLFFWNTAAAAEICWQNALSCLAATSKEAAAAAATRFYQTTVSFSFFFVCLPARLAAAAAVECCLASIWLCIWFSPAFPLSLPNSLDWQLWSSV